jgi:hypothetical protein
MTWSIGFMTVPRTVGRQPRLRLRPAFPASTLMCSVFPTPPIVARHLWNTSRISPDGKRSVAYLPSFATICAAALCYDCPEDAGAVHLQTTIRRQGLQEAIKQVSGVEPSSDFGQQVIAQYHSLRAQAIPGSQSRASQI